MTVQCSGQPVWKNGMLTLLNVISPAPNRTRCGLGRWSSALFLFISLTLTACSMDNTLPRHQIPPLFFPHRTEFLCKHELTVTPPVDPQAEIWYQQAVALDTPTLWKEDRDWP
ncbi:hypothetical protein QN360_18190, partial [Glaciimonas sp. CA11.2]|nr:hypothetical protein [Glaciimonas sp. CA11.2]